jgi:hypothetical protein
LPFKSGDLFISYTFWCDRFEHSDELPDIKYYKYWMKIHLIILLIIKVIIDLLLNIKKYDRFPEPCRECLIKALLSVLKMLCSTVLRSFSDVYRQPVKAQL